MTQVLFDNLSVLYEPQGSRIKEFYRHGQNVPNAVAFDVSNEKGGLRLSLNNTDDKGIMPNNEFDRKSMNLGFSYNLTEQLTVSANINYSRENNKNPPNIANQDNSIPTTLMAMSTSMPLECAERQQIQCGRQRKSLVQVHQPDQPLLGAGGTVPQHQA